MPVRREDILAGDQPVEQAAPLWNIASVAIPAAAIVIGMLVLAGSRGGGGDFAGALGGGVLFIFGVAGACVIGEIAAWVALVRGERMAWLTILGIIGNAVVILPVLLLLLKD